MTYPIISAKRISVGTAATGVDVNCNSVIIKNAGNGIVYFTEQGEDGAAVTADTGFALASGETFPVPLCAKKLSLLATAQSDVCLLFVGEGW